MTRVMFTAEGERFSLSAVGHAVGSVQACAAISGLFYALAGYLKRAGAEGLRVRLESGDARVEARGGAEVRAAFEMAVVGMEMVGKAVEGVVEVVMNCN